MIEDGIYPMFKVTITNFPVNIFPIVYAGEDGVAWSTITLANGTPIYVAIFTGLEDDVPVYIINTSVMQ